MFLVKWNDLTEKLVYRRFTEIYEFHVSGPGGGTSPCAGVPGLGRGQKGKGRKANSS